MSTRSRIGLMLHDGTIKQIYCHNDGEIGDVGYTLFINYNKEPIVKELINLGNLSVLGDRLHTDEPHSFQAPVEGVTIAYSRDRGEDEQEPQIVSLDEWMSESYTNSIEYYYLYSGGKWEVYDLYDNDGWKSLESFF